MTTRRAETRRRATYVVCTNLLFNINKEYKKAVTIFFKAFQLRLSMTPTSNYSETFQYIYDRMDEGLSD